MRDAIIRLFPQVETYDNSDRLRCQKFVSNSVNLVPFCPEEIAELESLKNRLDSEGLSDQSELINGVITKIKSVNKIENTKVETDVEALLEAEGYAIRQFPKFTVKKANFDVIRDAIKAFKKLYI